LTIDEQGLPIAEGKNGRREEQGLTIDEQGLPIVEVKNQSQFPVRSSISPPFNNQKSLLINRQSLSSLPFSSSLVNRINYGPTHQHPDRGR
jgi:hypothetical protein